MAQTNADHLPRTSPEAQGLASSALLDLIQALEDRCRYVHSVMVLRNGAVVAEGWWAPYRRGERHMLYSLSKSFTSTAAGLAIGEGKLSLDDHVLDFFPAERPAQPSANLAAMRLRHLLSMSTGHAEDTLPRFMRQHAGDWAKAFFEVPVQFEPGTHFLYNSGATYMVSAIVQAVTGQKVVDYLQPRLFEPLGIAQPPWEVCPRGINTGGWGLNLRTEDIARFGQLLLQDGVWQGRRLLPEGWVALASAKHVDNGDDPASDWAQGYGFQFWRCRHGAFRGDGAFGQLCVVLPEQDTVVAVTAGLDDIQGLLNVLWETLLPVLGPSPLPPDQGAWRRLTQRLDGLRLASPAGNVKRDEAVQHSALLDGQWFALEPNELGLRRLSFDLERQTLELDGERGAASLPWGWSGEWRDGLGVELLGVAEGMPADEQGREGENVWALAGYQTGSGRPVACTAGWQADGSFAFSACLYRTPAQLHLSCELEGDRLTIKRLLANSFFAGEKEALVGTAEG